MDVVFKEVVEFIGEGVDGAVYCFWDAVAQGEGEEGFVAGWEGDVLEFSEAVCYLDSLLADSLLCRWRRGERGRTCSPESLYKNTVSTNKTHPISSNPSLTVSLTSSDSSK